jgi:tetratricopeptide (TPR) repeat protein
VSDFGFDAYELDDVDAGGDSHPLEIARDLIAMGKARSALEVLSLHHHELFGDPEYLLLCSEAWRATGDVLRAQQALLGAARLVPDDPRPLQWLGELLGELGEHAKAERVLAKARSLASAGEPAEPIDDPAPDDLIAFAEQRERSNRAALNPRQILLVVAALSSVALLVSGILFLASPHPGEPLAPSSPTARVVSPPAASVPSEAAPLVEALSPTSIAEQQVEDLSETEGDSSASSPAPLAAPVTPAATESPEPSPRTPATIAVVRAARATATPETRARKAAPVRARRVAPPPPESAPAADSEPDEEVIRAELASATPAQLTTRADALDTQGQTALAAVYYRRALEIDPDYAPALVGIGSSILRAKKYSEAMRNATRALQLARGVDARPGLEAAAIYQLGRLHFERGDRDAARRLLRQSISLPGAPAEAWFYLGEALSSDNSPAAREAYEKYLELEPQGNLADRARRAIQ